MTPEKFNPANHLENQSENKEQKKFVSLVIIDDHRSFSEVLARNIESHFSGYSTKVFHEYSGQAAEYILNSGVDLVLVDVQLTSSRSGRWLSGDSVVADLRAQGYQGTIVFLTAGSMSREIAQKYGADGYIEKSKSEKIRAQLKSFIDKI